jgi:hypothetical protein
MPNMHSPVKQQDRELYKEIVEVMQELIKLVPNPIAVDALRGFNEVIDKLKVKINIHDYTAEDESFNRFDLT